MAYPYGWSTAEGPFFHSESLFLFHSRLKSKFGASSNLCGLYQISRLLIIQASSAGNAEADVVVTGSDIGGLNLCQNFHRTASSSLITLGMDKNVLQGLEGLPEEDKVRMAATIDQLQVRDSMRMYNSVVERCFNDCVDSFTRKSLQKQEETCVMRCAEKFLKHSMRVGLRFGELNNMQATPDQSN